MRTFQGPPHEFIVGKDGAEPSESSRNFTGVI